MSETRTLLLVHGADLLERLRALSRGLPWVHARGVAFEPIAGEVQAAVSEQRARGGALALGVITGEESDALAALASGADEAIALRAVGSDALSAFVDRVELRARLRAAEQRLLERYAHADKLTALGTLVAGVAHEINNPLAAMLLSIDAARRHLLPALELSAEIASAARHGGGLPGPLLEQLSRLGEAQERSGRDPDRVFEDIGTAAESIASIVRDLRVFARTDRDEPLALVEIRDIVDQALRLTGREVTARALVECDYAEGLPKLVVPRNRVTQVVINLLINAAHAVGERERPDHRIRISARADEEFVLLAVSDTGPGIAPDALERIFDPFFSTKREEAGNGLGLAISRSILNKLGGELSVESVYGDGATFLCLIPIPSREMLREAFLRKDRPTPPLPGFRAAQHSVLVVEDDERLLRSYVRLLNPLHHLLIARDAKDAIELLASGSAPNAIVLELDLPGADGRELLAWLEQQRPELYSRVLIVTSAASKAQYEPFLQKHRGPVLHKPVSGEQLLGELAQLLC
jgi:signal transduction histidine kinase